MKGFVHTIVIFAIIVLFTLVFVFKDKIFASDKVPVGEFQSVKNETCSIDGWAYDPDTPVQSISVLIYADGSVGTGTKVGEYKADLDSEEVNKTNGYTGKHGFVIKLDEKSGVLDGKEHSIYVYGINSAGNDQNTHLSGSPRKIQCLIINAGVSIEEMKTSPLITVFSPQPSPDISNTLFTDQDEAGGGISVASSVYVWPTKYTTLTWRYGYSACYGGNKEHKHWGIDLRAPTGTPVLAVTKSKVEYAGNDFYDPQRKITMNTGKTIVLANSEGTKFLYGHLSSIGVSTGKEVSVGQEIGKSGATGFVDGAHLHFGILTKSSSSFVWTNPVYWLKNHSATSYGSGYIEKTAQAVCVLEKPSH